MYIGFVCSMHTVYKRKICIHKMNCEKHYCFNVLNAIYQPMISITISTAHKSDGLECE